MVIIVLIPVQIYNSWTRPWLFIPDSDSICTNLIDKCKYVLRMYIIAFTATVHGGYTFTGDFSAGRS